MSADGAENVPDWSKIFLKSFPAAERVLGSLNYEDMAACLEVCTGWRKVAITMIGMKTALQKRGALLWAYRKEKPDYTEVLLACGADAETASQTGWTPLHCAIHFGSLEVLKVLLAHGVNVDGPLLKKADIKMTPLLSASKWTVRDDQAPTGARCRCQHT